VLSLSLSPSLSLCRLFTVLVQERGRQQTIKQHHQIQQRLRHLRLRHQHSVSILDIHRALS